jgi:hypothetical protein
MDLVIYHNACTDGFCAAYIAHKRWPNATFMPRNYGMEPPYAEVEGKDVLVVDFSWRTSLENCELARRAKSFRILDHHKTAAESLAGLPFATFDMNRSGAGLAWDELFGKEETINGGITVPGLSRPWFVDYIEDRDIWRWALPNSRTVNAFIGVVQFDFDAWDAMIGRATVEQAIKYGGWINLEIEKYVTQAVKQAQFGQLFYIDPSGYVSRYNVALVNAAYEHGSEVCEALDHLPSIDIGMIWFERTDGKIQFSMSSHNSDADMSKIARTRGGGGHRTKGGFELNIVEGRNLIDSILGRSFAEKDRVFQAPPIISLDKNVFRA